MRKCGVCGAKVFPVTTLGGRLHWALNYRERSKRWFTQQLHRRGVYGASYPTVLRYMNDERSPQMDFIVASAKILEVRICWLAAREGEPHEPQ